MTTTPFRTWDCQRAECGRVIVRINRRHNHGRSHLWREDSYSDAEFEELRSAVMSVPPRSRSDL